MPSNKLASFRYRILNDCFRNLGKPYWTLNELIEHVSEKIIENFSLNREKTEDFTISKRTIQYDIADMRADPPLGYGAPIKCEDKKYFYENKNFSINETSLSEKDVAALNEAALLLRQFSGLPHYEGLEKTLLQIECWTGIEKQHSLVQFEANEYVGMDYIKPLYEAIHQQKAVAIQYLPFDKTAIEHKVFFPYFLKEFRNRWYVVGQEEQSQMIQNLALDRIDRLQVLQMKPFRAYPDGFVLDTYYNDVIGVTVYADEPIEEICFKVSPTTAPYLMTKPLHRSQRVIGKDEAEWVIFQLQVKSNYELKAELLRLGAALEVISPLALRETIRQELTALLDRYK